MDLIIDCSRKGVRIALSERNFLAELNEPNAKGDELNLLLNKLLCENNSNISQIKRVLTTLGPGSFTGIRIGIAFCEGLCFSGKRTLHGISTLQALREQNSEVFLHARANFYYKGTAEGESVVKLDTAPQTAENEPIANFAKLIDAIQPSRIQKANYLMNPYI